MNAYREVVDPLRALGDATRRSIVDGLRDGERTVGELAANLPVSRPAVSQHLAVLRSAGLVLERPHGTRHYYRLDPIGLVRLHARLDAMWGLEPMPSDEPGTAPPAAEPSPAASESGGGGKGSRKKRKKKDRRK